VGVVDEGDERFAGAMEFESFLDQEAFATVVTPLELDLEGQSGHPVKMSLSPPRQTLRSLQNFVVNPVPPASPLRPPQPRRLCGNLNKALAGTSI
jgi:hypothetical protein